MCSFTITIFKYFLSVFLFNSNSNHHQQFHTLSSMLITIFRYSNFSIFNHNCILCTNVLFYNYNFQMFPSFSNYNFIHFPWSINLNIFSHNFQIFLPSFQLFNYNFIIRIFNYNSLSQSNSSITIILFMYPSIPIPIYSFIIKISKRILPSISIQSHNYNFQIFPLHFNFFIFNNSILIVYSFIITISKYSLFIFYNFIDFLLKY